MHILEPNPNTMGQSPIVTSNFSLIYSLGLLLSFQYSCKLRLLDQSRLLHTSWILICSLCPTRGNPIIIKVSVASKFMNSQYDSH
ncbi:hypothetical protein Lal_00012720 [Lupinus albus]|nr:hypothetical protein Lal_00012720 [Lupinus albus]